MENNYKDDPIFTTGSVKPITVGDLKKVLADVPEDTVVEFYGECDYWPVRTIVVDSLTKSVVLSDELEDPSLEDEERRKKLLKREVIALKWGDRIMGIDFDSMDETQKKINAAYGEIYDS